MTGAEGHAAAGAAAAAGGGVRIFVRLRPPSEKTDIKLFEFSAASPRVITIKDPLSSGRCEHSYEFSGIFGPDDNQDKVFTPVAGPVVDAALAGHSGCVIAYGQTGSGKTFSIFGEGNEGRRGILPRAVERLFAQGVGVGRQGVTVSFLEVYLDQVRDLCRDGALLPASEGAEGGASADAIGAVDAAEVLADAAATGGAEGGTATGPSELGAAAGGRSGGAPLAKRGSSDSVGGHPGRGLQIRESAQGRVHVKGLTQFPVRGLGDVRRIIDRGLARRATAVTAANVQSSRSHTVFTVHLPAPGGGAGPAPNASGARSEAAGADDGFNAAAGTALSFVDLAGSERLAKSRAEGLRFTEAVSINSSLTALGKVVLALASKLGSTQHVPYRDSKLTRLLSPSLAGGSQIAILAAVHPRVEDYEESLNTLSFADRCKNVAHQPQVNYISAEQSSQLRIKDLEQQIRQLQETLHRQQLGHAASMDGPGGLVASLGLGTPRKSEANQLEAMDKAIADAISRRGGAARATGPAAAANGASGAVAAHAVEVGSVATAAPTTGEGGDSAGTAGEGLAAAGGPTAKFTTGADARKVLAASREQLVETLAISMAPTGPTDPGIQDLMLLQEERKKQARAQAKAVHRMEALEQERMNMQQQAAGRTAEIATLAQKTKKLEAEKERVQAELQQCIEAQLSNHDHDFKELRDKTERRLQETDDTLMRISANRQKGREDATQRRLEYEERGREFHDQHVLALRQLKEKNEEELSEMRAQWRAQLDRADLHNEELAAELEQVKVTEDGAVMEYQDELLSLTELAARLARSLAQGEDGLYPTLRWNGQKQVVLPDGARPADPAPEDFPRLFDALAKADQKVSTLERAARRPISAGRTRMAIAAAVGAYDGELATMRLTTPCGTPASPGAARHPLFGHLNLDNTQWPPVEGASSASATARGSIGLASVREGGCSDRSDLDVRAADTVRTCVEALSAADVDDVTAEKFLKGLSVETLVSLSFALRARSLEAFSPGGEKEVLRRGATAGLEDEATLRYLRQLEGRRDAARAAIAGAVEQGQHLRHALESRKCGLPLPISSRPTTASRSLSRPRTPSALSTTRAGSRPSTRPGTATSPGPWPPPNGASGGCRTPTSSQGLPPTSRRGRPVAGS